MRVLLDSFSKQERALFLEEHKVNRATVFVHVVGMDTVAVFNFAFLALARVLFNPIILGIIGCSGKRACTAFS